MPAATLSRRRCPRGQHQSIRAQCPAISAAGWPRGTAASGGRGRPFGELDAMAAALARGALSP
eukprot:10622547-Alexandrium_andersonii.AAC.1